MRLFDGASSLLVAKEFVVGYSILFAQLKFLPNAAHVAVKNFVFLLLFWNWI